MRACARLFSFSEPRQRGCLNAALVGATGGLKGDAPRLCCARLRRHWHTKNLGLSSLTDALFCARTPCIARHNCDESLTPPCTSTRTSLASLPHDTHTHRKHTLLRHFAQARSPRHRGCQRDVHERLSAGIRTRLPSRRPPGPRRGGIWRTQQKF